MQSDTKLVVRANVWRMVRLARPLYLFTTPTTRTKGTFGRFGFWQGFPSQLHEVMVSYLLAFTSGMSLLVGSTSGQKKSPIPLSIAKRSTAQLASSMFIASSTVAVATAAVAAPTTPSLAIQLDDKLYTKSQFNLPPSLATYPSSFAGIWEATYKFVDASFTTDIPLKQLSTDVNVAGFRKYSVAFAPDIGADFVTNVQFKLSPGSDTSVVEDRQFNLINALQSVNKATVDQVVYEPDKNANRLSLKYTDPRGTGKIELFSNSRSQGMVDRSTFPASLFATYRRPGQQSPAATANKPTYGSTTDPTADSSLSTPPGTGTGSGPGPSFTSADLAGDGYRTFETLRQVTVRSINGQQASEIYCDYGLECVYYPLSSATGGGSGSDGSDVSGGGVDSMLATVKIFSYLIPQDGLYFTRAEKPVGVFLYAVAMRRV